MQTRSVENPNVYRSESDVQRDKDIQGLVECINYLYTVEIGFRAQYTMEQKQDEIFNKLDEYRKKEKWSYGWNKIVPWLSFETLPSSQVILAGDGRTNDRPW